MSMLFVNPFLKTGRKPDRCARQSHYIEQRAPTHASFAQCMPEEYNASVETLNKYPKERPMTNSTTQAAPESAPQSGRHKVISFTRELLETVLIAVVVFFLLQIVVKNFRVTGESMMPTLSDGQFLLVDKLSYRFTEPKRGEIIVFRYPRDPSEDYIKRIIGLPGETVRVAEGSVYIDGQILHEPYLQSQPTLAYRPLEIRLGEDEFFVLGDNRRYSSDSRTWGPVARRNIIGRAWFCYWPPPQWGFLRTPAYP